MRRIAFRKMHGLGNDFVVIDQRAEATVIDGAAARALADRHTGIGCDQVILIETPRDPAALVFMRILNADGSEAAACGNGARCIARLIAEETGERHVRLETLAGLLDAELLADWRVAVDMGPARWTRSASISPPGCSRARSAPASATRTPRSLSAMPMQSIWRRSGPFSNTTRCSPNAPISGSPRCAAPSGSGCASGSAAPGSPRPAAAALAPRWSPPIAAG